MDDRRPGSKLQQSLNCSLVDVDHSPLVDVDGTFHDQNRTFHEDQLVLLASLDISAVFDIVNVGLLIKRLRVIGLPLLS